VDAAFMSEKDWSITMAKTNFKSVDEYIASQPEAAQGVLKRVRSTIRKAVPGAAEVICSVSQNGWQLVTV
jgi:uncharacterized protein YdhG (YjbR/CyaY superfamily)